MNITFIGTGVMGASMAMHLLRAGHTLSVYNRTKEKAQKLIDEGAVFKENVKASVKDADVVITMVGFPKDVEEVYFGDGGIIELADEPHLHFEMKIKGSDVDPLDYFSKSALETLSKKTDTSYED